LKGIIDALADYRISPTLTLAVDSLYFSSDLDGLIAELKAIPRNRLYSCIGRSIF
jgi:hypothetical protein